MTDVVKNERTVVVIEDDAHIADLLDAYLREAGFRVLQATHGERGLELIAQNQPDMVLLDIGLPDIDGFEVCRRLRAKSNVPVLFLTARDGELDRILGLELGADDYVTKPFSPRELLARINAVLRRTAQAGTEDVIDADGLVLDAASHRVMAGEGTVQLGPTEYRLLSFFMTHPERVYSRAQLLDRVWGGNVYVEERTVDVHIRRLRKALEVFGYDRFIQTVRGSGYRFSTRVA
jgi:two-component system phosphate regulon response regulator PhoB